MEPRPSEINQSEAKVGIDDKELVDFVLACIKSSENHKTKFGYNAEKDRFDRLYSGKLYENEQQNKLFWESKCNYYAYYVDAMANLLTRETIDDYVYRADKKTDDTKAELFSRILEYIHFVNGEFVQDWFLCADAGKYGNGFYYVFYDKEADEFQGLPSYRSIDPRFVGMSPGCEDVDKAAWCYTKYPVSTASIRRSYPDLEIRPDPEISIPDTMNQGSGITVTDSSSGVQVSFGLDGKKTSASGTKGEQTYLITFYWKDPAIVLLNTPEEVSEWVKKNPGFGKKSPKVEQYISAKVPVEVPVYPHGRKIQIASKQKLEDAPHPCDSFPLVNFPMYPVCRDPWAQGIIYVIREMVQNIHLVSSGMAANADFINRPFWVTDDPGIKDDSDSFTTNPNELKKLTKVGAKLEAAKIPSGVKDSIELIQFRLAEIERRTGLKEIMFGQRGIGNYTGIQTELLQDAAKGSLVPIFKRFNEAKTRLGNKLFWMAQNYMTTERVLTFVNPDDGEEAIQMVINEPVEDGSILNNVTDGDWKYYVRETSGVPFSKTQQFKQKAEVAQLIQTFDPVEAAVMGVEATDMQGKGKVIKLIRDRGEQRMGAAAEAEKQKMAAEMAKVQAKQATDQEKVMVQKILAGADTQLKAEQVELIAAQVIKTLAEAQNVGKEKKEKPNA